MRAAIALTLAALTALARPARADDDEPYIPTTAAEIDAAEHLIQANALLAQGLREAALLELRWVIVHAAGSQAAVLAARLGLGALSSDHARLVEWAAYLAGDPALLARSPEVAFAVTTLWQAERLDEARALQATAQASDDRAQLAAAALRLRELAPVQPEHELRSQLMFQAADLFRQAGDPAAAIITWNRLIDADLSEAVTAAALGDIADLALTVGWFELAAEALEHRAVRRAAARTAVVDMTLAIELRVGLGQTRHASDDVAAYRITWLPPANELTQLELARRGYGSEDRGHDDEADPFADGDELPTPRPERLPRFRASSEHALAPALAQLGD